MSFLIRQTQLTQTHVVVTSRGVIIVCVVTRDWMSMQHLACSSSCAAPWAGAWSGGCATYVAELSIGRLHCQQQ